MQGDRKLRAHQLLSNTINFSFLKLSGRGADTCENRAERKALEPDP